MKTVPTSFDFTGEAIRPDYVVKCSYGNDSIALIQWLHEYNQKHPLGKVVVLYNDTKWATNWWINRVENGERLAVRYGFIPQRTESIGMMEVIFRKRTWPNELQRFCTQVLKIEPTMVWLGIHDSEGIADLVCGVRREESAQRRNWPEWVDSHEANEGRSQWSPLVYHSTEERDQLILRAGWKPLPHRSRECRCVNANSQDILTWSEEDIRDIEFAEAMMQTRCHGDNAVMFPSKRKKGRPYGIREVVKWAKAVNPKDAALEPGGGCDSGYCTS